MHKVTLEEQEHPYIEKAGALNEEIEQAIKSHDLEPGDAGYERYNALREKLKEAKFTEKDCGRHKQPKQPKEPKKPKQPKEPKQPKTSCKYCSMSLSQIYQRMNDCYVKIHTRKATKQDVIGEVNALYKCASQHSSEWKSGGGIKSKIQQTYDRIKKAK